MFPLNKKVGIFILITMPIFTWQECRCFNPYEQSLQPQIGEPNRRCQTTGTCFVPCRSTCGDSHAATGFGSRGKCASAEACGLPGGTTALESIRIDLGDKKIRQNCKDSKCKQINNINIEVKPNCGFSNCIN